MIRRRLVVVLVLGAVALCGQPLAMAQEDPKVFRIGAVSAGAPRSSPHWVALGQRLGELGYVEAGTSPSSSEALMASRSVSRACSPTSSGCAWT